MSRLKKYFIWAAILLAIAAAVFYFIRSRQPETEYITETAQKGSLVQTVSVTGKIIPEEEVNLAFELSGEVSQVYFEVGDEVKRSDRLAQLKAGTILADLEQAEKALEAQRQTYEHMKDEDDTYSKEQVRSQKAVIEQYEAAVQKAKVNLYKTILFSPIDGVVTKREISIGETVTANVPVFTVMGSGSLEVEVNVPESDIAKIVVGQKATLTFDALSSDEKFEAEVVKIDPAATVIQDVVYYKAEFKLLASDGRLKPGMSVDADIETARKDNVVFVPQRAVKEESGRQYVEVLGPDGVNVTRVDVRTGIKGDEGVVEIISGLSGGEEVVTLEKTQ